MESTHSDQPKRRGRPPRQKDPSDALEASMDKNPPIIKAVLSGHVARDPSKTIPEQIAGNSVIFFNWKWKDAEKDFPIEPWLRTVKHCFIYAKGGMILADYPQIKGEFTACERKAKVLKERGFRYIAVTPEMTVLEAMEILGDGNG